MRKLPAGVVLSAAVHAAAAVWVSAYTPAPAPVPPEPPTVIELVDVSPAAPEGAPPLEVTVLVDELTAPAEEPAAPADEPADKPEAIAMIDPDRGPRAPSADRGAGAGSNTGAEPSGPPTRNPLLDMRKGAPVRLTIGVPTGRLDGHEHAPESFGPELDSGQLAPAGGGTHRADQGTFTAKVERDGSVSLKDSRNFNIQIAIPGKKALGNKLRRWLDDPNKPVGSIMVTPTERAPQRSLDELTGKDDKPDHGETVAIVKGGFDITDALMRHQGIDPYASKKLKFLDSTRDERVQIGNRHRQQQLARAPEIMRANLARLWATVSDPAARRAALFELWDECAETGSAALVAAGRDARLLVIGFIRTKAPAGTAIGFTPGEIAALNRKRVSRARFAPYE